MSGGRYDYACSKVLDMTEQMGWDLDHPSNSMTTLEVDQRKKVIRFLESVADLMRAIEWEDSGDGADWHSIAQELINEFPWDHARDTKR